MNVLRLIPEQGGEVITIALEKALIGRDPVCEVHLQDGSVSRRHAEIQQVDDEWVIADLNSGNGVLVDNISITHSVLLPGQRVQFGNLAFRVEIDRGDEGSTVILGRSPLDQDLTMISPGPPPAPAPKRRTLLPIIALAAAALLAVALGLAAAVFVFQRLPRENTESPTPTPLVVANVAPTPTPLPPTPSPAPKREAPRPRGVLLVSTDTRAVVSVDGRRHGTVRPGGLLRIEVPPGQHIVGFGVGSTRHDEVVRAKANEQTVVRFLGSAPAPAILPIPRVPAMYPTVRATPSPASPTPPVARPADSPVAGASESDEGLHRGIAATTAGDFQRAVLILRDVVKRLEKDRSAKRDLARAQAYLAWNYHGLKRPGPAEAAAEKAVRADPEVLARLEGFPKEVVRLLRRAR